VEEEGTTAATVIPSDGNSESSLPSVEFVGDRNVSDTNETAPDVFDERLARLPVGSLDRRSVREMLAAMRHLSAMDRRREVVASGVRERRRDAVRVERYLDRLLLELEHAVRNSESSGENGPRDEDDNAALLLKGINSRTYGLAIKAWASSRVRNCAEKAERVLRRLLEVHRGGDAEDSERFRPDIYSFAHCYAAWFRESAQFSAMGNDRAASAASRRAEVMLRWMEQNLRLMSTNHPVTDVNTLLEMWSSSERGAPLLAEHFLKFVASECDRGGSGVPVWVNARSFNIVINAWSKSGQANGVTRAEALLNQMEQSDDAAMPDCVSYSAVITCVSKGAQAPSQRQAGKAKSILRRMESSYKNGNKNARPDRVIYNQVINLYSKSNDKGSAKRTERVLERMQKLADAGNVDVKPDVRTYNLVLTAWAKEEGPTKAEEILKRLESHDELKPNDISYTTVIDAYSKRGDVHNALRVLSMMELSFNKGNLDAKPTRRAYTSALNALAKSGRGDAGVRAEALVQTMQMMHKAGNSDLKPDTYVFNALIQCHKSSATRAEKVLYKMGKRDVVSYSSVINAYSQQGGIEAAKRAQFLLEEMEKEDVEPNALTYNSAITAWSRSGTRDSAKKAEELLSKMERLYEAGNADLKPTVMIYTSVISAWANSREPGAALRAEVLLKVMRVMHKRGNKAMKPNARTFTSVINAWSKSGEKGSGDRAEALLNQMIELFEAGDYDVKPNAQTLTAVVDAHARSGERDAATKADILLKRMEEVGVKPNLQTYNALIAAWSKNPGAARKAESILRKIEETYYNGDISMRPSVVSYTSTINAWVRSLDSDKAVRAQKILERMKQVHKDGNTDAKPNTVTYTSVINACAKCRGNQQERDEAIRIAYNTFKELELENYGDPNHVTYMTFIKAVGKLMPIGEKRDAILSTTFRKACRDGQVSENCLLQLKSACSDELLSELISVRLLDVSSVSIDDLPMKWKRNVDVSNRPRSLNKK